MGLNFLEIIIIVMVILVVFGPKRIPEFSRALGRGIREFRKAMHELESQLQDQTRPVRDTLHDAISNITDKDAKGEKNGTEK